ncbi:hypothetical protein VHUM_03075 [Vanrija humicola]|uniref:Nudix hydrolase domain-containing protein n=1 Tax=Vanrija humicola TaxID=5417 RepID=A0A7D8UXJ2_VANHU|nr:hypothetical protein VHUM_03075 [Vanrija humicola]
MLLSPTNQLLLLHRVTTSSAFASAHVFPGGTLSEFHESVPAVTDADRHTDSRAYRLAAVRETFEESGILLAKRRGEEGLVELSVAERTEGRKAIHGDKVKFLDFLARIGAEPDLDNLIPLTRWITPPNAPKRFSAQMYLYLLSADADAAHDGGLEHTDAEWADVADWNARARRGDIIVYEPQAFLLALLADFFPGPGVLATQRARLLDFIAAVPTGPSDDATGAISWANKVICSYVLPVRRDDGYLVIGLDEAGPELEGTGRGGDFDRVVLVNSEAGGPRGVEVRLRRDVVPDDVGLSKL